jgi:hypothetical protein
MRTLAWKNSGSINGSMIKKRHTNQIKAIANINALPEKQLIKLLLKK